MLRWQRIAAKKRVLNLFILRYRIVSFVLPFSSSSISSPVRSGTQTILQYHGLTSLPLEKHPHIFILSRNEAPPTPHFFQLDQNAQHVGDAYRQSIDTKCGGEYVALFCKLKHKVVQTKDNVGGRLVTKLCLCAQVCKRFSQNGAICCRPRASQPERALKRLPGCVPCARHATLQDGKPSHFSIPRECNRKQS